MTEANTVVQLLIGVITLLTLMTAMYYGYVKWIRKVAHQVQPSNGTSLAHIVEQIQKRQIEDSLRLQQINEKADIAAAKISATDARVDSNEKLLYNTLERLNRRDDTSA